MRPPITAYRGSTTETATSVPDRNHHTQNAIARPKRVLIVTGIFPPDIGGPATYVPLIAEALTKQAHVVTVLTLSESLDHDDKVYPFKVVRLARPGSKPWRWIKTIATLIKLGRSVDVLYVNGLSLESYIANLALRRPLIQKIVGDEAWERARNLGWLDADFEDFQRRRHQLKIEMVKSLRTWPARRADRIIVPSHYLAQRISGWGVSREKIATIYNGADVVECRPVTLPLATKVNVVTSGRLVSWKHVDGVMEALAPLGPVGLVVIGNGPKLDQLRGLALHLGMSDRVFFAGALERRDALALTASCDVFVLNSLYEGFPHAVLEAMLLGVPVIATAVGGTTELIQDGRNGRLIPPMDVRELRKALVAILSNPTERLRLALAARESASRFDTERMVRGTCDLLVGDETHSHK